MTITGNMSVSFNSEFRLHSFVLKNGHCVREIMARYSCRKTCGLHVPGHSIIGKEVPNPWNKNINKQLASKLVHMIWKTEFNSVSRLHLTAPTTSLLLASLCFHLCMEKQSRFWYSNNRTTLAQDIGTTTQQPYPNLGHYRSDNV